MDVLTHEAAWLLMPVTVSSITCEPSLWAQPGHSMPWVCWISCDEAGLLVACGADWAAAWGDVMGCRNSKVLPEPPGDVQLDLVKKVGVRIWLCSYLKLANNVLFICYELIMQYQSSVLNLIFIFVTLGEWYSLIFFPFFWLGWHSTASSDRCL